MTSSKPNYLSIPSHWVLGLQNTNDTKGAGEGHIQPITKMSNVGFPGGAVVGSPPANAGDTGLSPDPGGSHMPRSGWARVPQLLSLRSGAHKSQMLGTCAGSPSSSTGEATMMRGPGTAAGSGPRLLQLEKSPRSNEDPTQPKIT